MEKKMNHQMSESYRLGILLAITGGFLDAYTYISRGGVFANAQTGNILLFGMNIAEGKISEALQYLIPILAFVAGVILVEYIKERCKDNDNRNLHWRQIIVIQEMAVLLVVAFVPSGPWNMVVNIAISFVCSMQVESFRKVHGNAYATTMCTGNLRSAAEQQYRYHRFGDKAAGKRSLQYYGIIFFFVLGAVMGMFVTRLIGEISVVLCAVLLFAVFCMMFVQVDEEH